MNLSHIKPPHRRGVFFVSKPALEPMIPVTANSSDLMPATTARAFGP